MSWSEITIAELGEIITGKTPPTSAKENYGGSIPFITPSDMVGNRTVTETERYISEQGKTTVKNCVLPSHVVCVSCIGSDMGKAIITSQESITNQQINSIICKPEYDYRFVYYLMLTLRDTIRSLGKNATAVPILNKSKFSSIHISVPQLSKQKQIADILSGFDDLIENNQKQIKLLEEAAQRLYKEWFVDLRFPGHENTPIVDGVPEGWSLTNINAVMTFHRGYDLTKNSMIPGKYPVIGSTSIIGYHNQYKIKGPGIVTGRSGSLGEYQLTWEDYWPHNTALYVSDMKGHHVLYLYSMLQTVDFSGLNNGGAIPTLNRNTLSNIAVIEATKALQDEYVRIVEPIYSLIKTAKNQIKYLQETRDRLLPKLMNGEIEV